MLQCSLTLCCVLDSTSKRRVSHNQFIVLQIVNVLILREESHNTRCNLLSGGAVVGLHTILCDTLLLSTCINLEAFAVDLNGALSNLRLPFLPYFTFFSFHRLIMSIYLIKRLYKENCHTCVDITNQQSRSTYYTNHIM